MARMWLVLTVALAAIAGALPGSPDRSAPDALAEISVEWNRYDVELDLHGDGSVHILERQEVRFGQGYFREGFAEIPMQRIDAIEDVRVREETPAGSVFYQRIACCPEFYVPATYSVQRTSLGISVVWGFEPASNETRVFVLEYTARGVVRVYDDPDPSLANQQLWWTAIGQEVTDVSPVRHAAVTLRLPKPVPLDQVVIAQNGALLEPREHTTDGQVWLWEATDLARGDHLDVRLQFPNIVAASKPSWQQRDDDRRRKEEEATDRRMLLSMMFFGMGLLVLAAGGVVVYGLWYAHGRDPHAGVEAAFRPEPPDDLPPGVVGALVDEVVNELDIVATLVDLARRGVLAMRETTMGYGRDIELTFLGVSDHLTVFERGVLEALFGQALEPGQQQLLFRVQGQFAQAVPRLRALLDHELVLRGYFSASPHETREAWRTRALRGVVFTAAGGLALWIFVFRTAGWFWFPVAVVLAGWIVLYLMSGAMPRKTRAGAEAAARWNAFRQYLADIERYDRLAEARERFERFLPFAVAFGLEQSWTAKFAAVGAGVPRWYQLPALEWAGSEWQPRPRRGSTGVLRSWSWWDVTGDGTERQPADGPRHGGNGLPSVPDWQGTSDHAARSLSRASSGLLSLFEGAGRALAAFAEFSASGSDSRRSGGWSAHSGRAGRFRGGGFRGGASGGGRRGFR